MLAEFLRCGTGLGHRYQELSIGTIFSWDAENIMCLVSRRQPEFDLMQYKFYKENFFFSICQCVEQLGFPQHFLQNCQSLYFIQFNTNECSYLHMDQQSFWVPPLPQLLCPNSCILFMPFYLSPLREPESNVLQCLLCLFSGGIIFKNPIVILSWMLFYWRWCVERLSGLCVPAGTRALTL